MYVCTQQPSSCHSQTRNKVEGGGQKSANSIRDPAVRALCEVGISALSFFGANICSGLSVSLVFPL